MNGPKKTDAENMSGKIIMIALRALNPPPAIVTTFPTVSPKPTTNTVR
jgi:hypothetical protein